MGFGPGFNKDILALAKILELEPEALSVAELRLNLEKAGVSLLPYSLDEIPEAMLVGPDGWDDQEGDEYDGSEPDPAA